MKKLVLSLLTAVVVAGVFFSVKAYAFPHDKMCSVIDDEDYGPYDVDKYCDKATVKDRCGYSYTHPDGGTAAVTVPGSKNKKIEPEQ